MRNEEFDEEKLQRNTAALHFQCEMCCNYGTSAGSRSETDYSVVEESTW